MASKTRSEKYRRDLDDILQVQEHGVLEKVKAWLIPVMNDKVDVTRDILSYAAECLDKMDDASLKKSIYLFMLDLVNPRAYIFKWEIITMRLSISDLYSSENEFKEAAEVLVGIPFERLKECKENEIVQDIYLKISSLYLDSDSFTEAEFYLKLVKPLLAADSEQIDRFEEEQVIFLLKMVKFLKQKGKCIELSEKFIELSENIYKISKRSLGYHGIAIQFAIMAPAGLERSQLLTTLYQDQRNKQLPKEYLSVMEKVLQERLIKQCELTKFESIVNLTSDFNIAILEHNLLVASKLYTSVKLQKLAQQLEMEPEMVETRLTKLFEEDRICGSITTSTETVVHFGTRQPPAATPASSSGVSEAGTEVAGASSMICWSCHSADGGPGGLFRCRGCKRARYCDPECQAADWERHQAYCVQKQGQREASKAEIKAATDKDAE